MGRNRCGEANGISDNPILPRKLPISAWALDDRPREKLLSRGASALSNAELLAILLGSGNAEESAVELAQHILNATGNLLNELGKLGVRELTSRFKGIGPAKAVTIMAAIEHYNGNILQAAKALGIGRNTLYAKMRKYQLS